MEERLAKIEEAIATLAEVMQEMCEKIDWHDQVLDSMKSSDLESRLSSVEKDFGDMVGGFTGMLGERRKSRIKDMLAGNESLKAYGPKYSKVYERDLLDDAVEEILKFLEQDGAGEEGIPGVIDQLVGMLKKRLDEEQAEGEGMAHEASESPAEEKAEHEGSEPEVKGGGKVIDFELSSEGPSSDVTELARKYRGRAL